MSTNRYDSPAQAQFMQTYVPIDFNSILQAGQSKQHTYDTNRMGFEQSVAEAQNLNYIPNSVDEEYITQHVTPTLESIRDKYLDKDYSDSEVVRQIYNDVRKGIDRTRISKIQKSYEGYSKDMDVRRKLQAEGKYADFLAFNPKEYDSRSGIYDYTTPAALDYRQKAESYFNNLEGSSYLGEDGQIHEYINEGTISKTAKGNLQSFLESPEGRQKLQELKYRGIKGQDAEKEVHDYLLEVGKEKIYNKIAGFEPGYAAGNKQPQPDIDNSSNTQSLRNENRVPEKEVSSTLGFNPNDIKSSSDLLKKLSFDSKGNISSTVVHKPMFAGPLVQSEFNKAKKEGKTSAKNVFEYKQQKEQKEEDKKYEKIKSQVEQIKRLNPNLIQNEDGRPVSDSQVLEAYSKAYQNLENQDYNTYLYETYKVSESAKARNNRQIVDDIAGRKLRVAESGKNSGKAVATMEDLYDEYDIPTEERKLENVVITGVAPSLNAYKAVINSTKGQKSFLISTSKREQNLFNLVEKATQLSSKGKVGEEQFELNGKKYIVTTRVEGNKGNYGFSSNIRTSDGSELIPGIGKNQMGMDAFEDYTVANFMFNL